eukprot:scaffold21923_cov77-Skeletonema_dohrnii-CCMP3373.AAC.4
MIVAAQEEEFDGFAFIGADDGCENVAAPMVQCVLARFCCKTGCVARMTEQICAVRPRRNDYV